MKDRMITKSDTVPFFGFGTGTLLKHFGQFTLADWVYLATFVYTVFKIIEITPTVIKRIKAFFKWLSEKRKK